LRTYLDGRPVGSPAASGDFFPWRARQLTLGGEPEVDATARGHLSHLAIHARELAPAEVAVEAERALAALAAMPRLAAVEVEAVLLARSRVPTLDEISPYTEALVVESWRVERVLGGELAEREVRVARWALVDAVPAPQMAIRPGARSRLRLEPFDVQPQLESLFLSDDATRPSGTLWYDSSLPGAR
ncbi:MAG: hypothetical protein K8I65_09160, partial [Thermoanaerobaculia bacterium]|nr:hypothetical protein [Thermoanaerobaculia bacterium]